MTCKKHRKYHGKGVPTFNYCLECWELYYTVNVPFVKRSLVKKIAKLVYDALKEIRPVGPVWSGRLPVTQEIMGSNPIQVAIYGRVSRYRLYHFLF